VENDSIRSSGSRTVVDVWVDGKVRAISVTEAAIGAYLGFPDGLSENDRCEFVRNNLALLIKAARNRLHQVGPLADSISIDVGDLPRSDGKSGDRRGTERRKAERRQSRPPLPAGTDRRKSDRRQGERRSPSPKKD